MAGIEQGVGFPIVAYDQFSGAFDKLTSRAMKAQSDFARVTGAVGMVFAAGGVTAFIKHAIDAHDAVYKLSQRLGIGVADLSQYKYALDLSDVSLEAFGKGIKTLSQRMVEATDGTSKAGKLLSVLGVNVGGSTSAAIEKIADTFAKLPDGATKAALAVELFDKKGMELIPWLNQGGTGIRKLREEALRLGLTMSEETARSAQEFNDNLKTVHATGQRLGISLVNEVAPSLVRISGAMKEAAEDGGLLKAALIGLGGVMAEALGLNDEQDLSKKIRNRRSELARLQAEIAGAANAGRIVQDKVAEDRAPRIAQLQQELSLLDRIAPRNAATKVADPKDKQIGSLQKQLDDLLSGKAGKSASWFERELANAAKAVSVARAELANGTDHLTSSEKKLLEVHQDPEWKKILPRQQAQIDARYREAVALERAARSLAFYTEENKKNIEAAGQRGDAITELVNGLDEESSRMMDEANVFALTNKEREKALLLIRMEGDLLAAGKNASAARDIADAYAKMFQAIDMKAFNDNQQSSWDRLHDTMQVIRVDAQTIGDVMANSFGRVGQAIAGLTKGLADFGERQAQINEAATKKMFAGWDAGDLASIQRAVEEANEASTKSTVKMYGDMAGSAKGFFKEHSAGYKTMEGIEKAFRAVELALAIKSFVTKITQITGVTAATVTGEGARIAAQTEGTAAAIALNTAEGESAAVVGVANQAKGDPYTAWARMAAMAAVMAGLGFIVGGGMQGAGAPNLAAMRQREQGTGSVLGDSGAQSQSIKNALEIIRNNTSDELMYASAMVTSLRNIESAMRGVASIVARSAGITGADTSGLNLGRTSNLSWNAAHRILGPVHDLGPGQRAFDMLFGTATRSLNDSGIQINAQTVGAAREGFSGSSYADVTTTRRALFGLINRSSTSRDTGALGTDITRQFTLLVDSMATSVKNAAVILGANGSEIESILNSMNIDLQSISFKDLKGDQIEAALEAVFGKIGDDMARLAMPTVTPFQRVGEGMFETLIRVASGVEQARSALDRFGIVAIDWTDITNKQGDVAVEIIRQSIEATETVGGVLTGVGKIVEGFDGTADDLVAIYQKLLDIRVLMRATGGDDGDLSQVMISAAGGLTAFSRGMQAFQENFFTSGERIAAAQRELTTGFERLGIAMPSSMEAFRALVLGIDTSTEAGQRFYGALIALAPAFADTANAIQSAIDQMHQAAASLSAGYGRQYAEAAVRQAAARWLAVSNTPWSIDQVLSEVGGLIRGGTNANPGGFGDALAFVEKLGPEAVGAFNELLNAYRGWQQSLQSGTPAIGTFTGSIGGAGKALDDLAKRTADAKQGIGDWLQNFFLDSNLSPLNPEQRLNFAHDSYVENLLKAQGGDLGALSDYTKFADSYIKELRAFYGSGSEYLQGVAGITGQASNLAGLTDVRPPSVADLKSGFQSVVDAIRDLQATVGQGQQRLGGVVTKTSRDTKATIDQAVRDGALTF